MGKQINLFTRSEVKKAKKKKRLSLSPGTLHQIGTRISKDINSGAHTPNMPSSGSNKPLLYILGEAPGREEDEQGVQFVGRSGSLLRDCIPKGFIHVRYDNACRTRPVAKSDTGGVKNRPPTMDEVECFRPLIEKDIARYKPKVILAVGGVATTWALGEKYAIKMLRGRKIPVEIAGHSCWLCPILHPSFIQRIENRREDKVSGKEWAKTFRKDIEEAIDLSLGTELAHVIKIDNPGSNVEILRGGDEDLIRLECMVNRFKGSISTLGFDFETEGLSPLKKNTRPLSISFAENIKSWGIALEHPQAKWKKDEYENVKYLLRDLFTSGLSFVAHELPFDLEWLIHLLGKRVIDRSQWSCSLQAAYVLDEREGAKSLDFMCLQEFGFQLKKLTKEGGARTSLASVDLEKVLRYNGLDAEWCLKLFKRLHTRIERLGLEQSYEHQINRVVPVVLARIEGMPVDQKLVKKFDEDLTKKIVDTMTLIHASPEVAAYEKKYGEFSVTSVPNMVTMLRDVMGRTEGQRGNKYSTDAAVLEAIREEEPFADLVLEMRGLSKLKGTYVDRFVFGHPQGYVYPDGLLHCNFKISTTRSSRLACEDPNNQNWPRRKHKEIRQILNAPPGFVIISGDYSQIEARVLAMASEDETWVDMLWKDYDVHLEWAEKVASIFPKAYEDHDRDIKGLRSAIKNQLVFPAFYGSSPESIARNIGMPEDLALGLFDEFWQTFAGIKDWQKRSWKSYQKHGYIDALTGFRRRRPLSFNMICNTPIQSDATVICVVGMNKLSRQAREEEKPWLQVRLQIHDELVFLVPKKHEEDAICDIIKGMLSFNAPWVNVPLAVEIKHGSDMYNMKEIGTFKSNDF